MREKGDCVCFGDMAVAFENRVSRSHQRLIIGNLRQRPEELARAAAITSNSHFGLERGHSCPPGCQILREADKNVRAPIRVSSTKNPK
jgi:hypothetical protein